MTETKTYSWSEINTAMSCLRKHELAYGENLQLKRDSKHRGMMLGSAFHAGLAEALFIFAYVNDDITLIIREACKAARKWVSENTDAGRTVELEDGSPAVDTAYYDMMNEIEITVCGLLEYYIPLIGLGTRYNVAFIPPRLHPNGSDADAFIEWEFATDQFHGVIDAVLKDLETDELVLVDWKLRSAFPYDELAAIDGQLPLYAAVLRGMGIPIARTVMWQFRNTSPKPAKINKNGQPSIAAQATTWEHWLETLPHPLALKLDRDEWYETLVEGGKLREETDFMNPVTEIVTDKACELTLANAAGAIALIEAMAASDSPAPAHLSSWSCRSCDFNKLCGGAFKHGFDPTPVIEELYEPRRPRWDEEDLD